MGKTAEQTVLDRLLFFKVERPDEVALIARKGDCSKKSYLAVTSQIERVGFVSVCAVIDKDKRFEGPNPRFCTLTGGGKSLALHAVLSHLFDKTHKDERGRAVFLGDSLSSLSPAKVILSRDRSGDIIVQTTDFDENIDGVRVLFDLGADHEEWKSVGEVMYSLNRTSPSLACGTEYIEWSREQARSP